MTRRNGQQILALRVEDDTNSKKNHCLNFSLFVFCASTMDGTRFAPQREVNATHFSRSIEIPLVANEADDTQRLDDAHRVRVQPKT
jgi:hypothetical protein